jgi:ribonucleoside-diphosphate reductase alpha chain
MHTTADAEAIGRLTSIALRVAKSNRKEIAEKIVQQLRGIGGSSQIGFGKDRVMSLADAIAKILAEDLSYVNQKEEVGEALPLNLTESDTPRIDDVVAPSRASEKLMADLCPSCGDAAFVMEEGCKKCHSCGYSLC